MIVFYIESLICLIFTFILYNRYADKKTELYVSVLVFLIWLLTFFNVVIVPLDIYKVSILLFIRVSNVMRI